MTLDRRTYSLPVLASMLEAETIKAVRFCIHGAFPADAGSCVTHYFTPEQLRAMDSGKNKLAVAQLTRFEGTGNLYATIGQGIEHHV